MISFYCRKCNEFHRDIDIADTEYDEKGYVVCKEKEKECEG